MELLLEEMCALRPSIEETNKTLQHLDTKLSFLYKPILDVVQDENGLRMLLHLLITCNARFCLSSKRLRTLKTEVVDNNLQIYGLSENLEGLILLIFSSPSSQKFLICLLLLS